MSFFTRNNLLHYSEKLLFFGAVLYLCGFTLQYGWLITEDGPSHIYNAIVANNLVLHPGSDPVFALNPIPVPNSLGHALLALLSAAVPVAVADKLFHLVVIAGIAYGFRSVVRMINPEQPLLSWLILPFVYSGIFFLGFYNFSLGIALSLFCLSSWLSLEKKFTRKKAVLAGLLCTLLFFTHLLPFALFLILAGLRVLALLFFREFLLFRKRVVQLFLILLPAALFFVTYYLQRTEITEGKINWADPLTTLVNFVSLHPLAVLLIEEKIPVMIFGAVLLLIMMVALFFLFRRMEKTTEEKRNAFTWIFSWLLFFVLLFAVPDDFGGSGAVTMRLVEICWLLSLLLIVAGRLPKFVPVLLAALCFGMTVFQQEIRHDLFNDLNQDGNKIHSFRTAIRPNSNGIYIPRTGNWLKLHAGEFLFAETNTTLLSDYETTHDFFPLVWKQHLPYDYTIGGWHPHELYCAGCYWPEQPGDEQRHVDYVLILDEYDTDTSCFHMLNDSLQKYYTLKKANDPYLLYESKTLGAH